MHDVAPDAAIVNNAVTHGAVLVSIPERVTSIAFRCELWLNLCYAT